MPFSFWLGSRIISFIADHLEAIITVATLLFSVAGGIYVYVNKVIGRFFNWLTLMINLPHSVTELRSKILLTTSKPLSLHLEEIQKSLESVNNRLSVESSKHQTLMDAIIRAPYAEIDTTGAITWHTLALESMFGSSRSLFGHAWRDLIHAEDRVEFEGFFNEAVRTKSFRHLVMRYSKNPNKHLFVELYPIATNDGQLFGFIALFALHDRSV